MKTFVLLLNQHKSIIHNC